MTQSQIEYYNSLPDESRQILQAAAFKATIKIDYAFQQLVYHFVKKQMSQKNIISALDDAVRTGLFTATKRWETTYNVSIDFLLFFFKTEKITPQQWRQIDERRDRSYSSYSESELTIFRDALYCLMYAPANYFKYQALAIQDFNTTLRDCFVALMSDDYFDKYLHKISKNIIKHTVSQFISNSINNLVSFENVARQIEKIELESDTPDLKELVAIELNKTFWKGNIAKAAEMYPDIPDFQAIKSLIDGDLKNALVFFGKSIKVQSKKSVFPIQSYIAYFYTLTLLLSDNQSAVPVFKKLIQESQKNTFYFYYLFVGIAYDQTGEQKTKLSELKSLMKINILRAEIDSFSILNILLYYLVGEKIDKKYTENIYKILKKAVDAEFLLLAYEAVFVAKKWFPNEARFADLYNSISQHTDYQPLISRINRQEDWEKSLNMLLGFRSKSAVKDNTDKSEKTARVVYYINPNSYGIQPVLQTRLKSGGWSKGRNIAMKTFHDCSTEGMTEHDMRIAKCVKIYNSYYSVNYEFERKIYIEMIGHPHIFLDGTDDVPVEFIEGQAVVLVTKTDNGYKLATNPPKYENIHIEKETNTRYKIYQMSANQQNIIRIINEEKLTIPDVGKEKLTEVLGTFSTEGFAVHSDLAANEENTSLEIREIDADSRIRVQLLPFGEGLKAELYVKPFGDRPPYCKAGKGGKVLIANENDVQLQVKRNLQQESANEQTLLNDIQTLETLNDNDGLLSFDDPLDSLYLLDILKDKYEICVVEWAEGERYKLRATVNVNQLSINVKSGINWFDLQGELRIDENTVVSLQTLLQLTEKSHNRFIELSNGEFLALSNRLKKQLDALRMFADSDKKGVRLNKFASVGLGDFFDELDDLKADKQWQDFRKSIANAQHENAEIPQNLNAELREYQADGFRWMARLAAWNAGACLADDMGLGKTVQTLAMLLHRAKLGAALVVCPVSVVGNWIAEAERFAPALNFKTLGTSASDRKSIIDNLAVGDVLLTSYGLLQSEEKLFTETRFATAVLDEAHVIKNYATKTSKAIMQLQADFRVALTGTPLQNHLGEVWNLFNFINPGLLGNLQHFNDLYIKTSDENAKKNLKKLISPFILRRVKSAVLDELPPKTEIVRKIALTAEETAFYEALRRQALENLENADEAKHIQVLAEITKLRLASCNPKMIDAKIKIPSSKLNTFLDIVAELKENKHRALVFSQFVKHLDIVRQALDNQGITYQYIDGGSTQKEREQSVTKFQAGEGDLFLISLKAGGLGLNLTAADFVIHLDPWWNPAVEDQASDRAHRIGQQRAVTIYRLVAEGTIEEKILQLHAHKRDLAEQLLEGSDTAAKLSVNEMIALIKEGVKK